MLLFKTYTFELEFDRHPELEHLISYQGMQSGLPVLLVGELDTVEIIMQKSLFGKA